ncbi:cytochrome P450 [Nonomuraea sp. SYSU D8015]|uniref:cytochrome P450 n=1 Tax=Nonomuraea sp. SYSU D8015 TaxID=2593644 RepID=UPI001CB72AF8|nr:cytochrome P450 [Nonomuraea sp. SYSU D8015]
MAVRYDDVRALLACPHSSRDLTAPGLPRMVTGFSADDVPGVLITMHGADHERQRRILQRAFTVNAAERWRPQCREIAHELLDGVDGSVIDIVADYALPLSARMICQVLGVPASDWARFHNWTAAFLSATAESAETRIEAFVAFRSYLEHLVAAHRNTPGHDLVDDLIRAQDEGDRLSQNELVNVLFVLIAAGHESASTMITRGVYRLLLHPEQCRTLQATPALVRSAVEEILRYDGPGAPGLLRLLTEKLDLPSGATVAAGTVVLPNINAANHDPDAFPEPQRFDIRRFAAATRPHLAFGHGAHFCLGANLARMELQEALSALLLRAPGLRPALSLDDVRWTTQLFHQPLRLPVILA